MILDNTRARLRKRTVALLARNDTNCSTGSYSSDVPGISECVLSSICGFSPIPNNSCELLAQLSPNKDEHLRHPGKQVAVNFHQLYP